jgi:hypothetical protein
MIQRLRSYFFLRAHMKACRAAFALAKHGAHKRKQAWEAKRNQKTEQLRQEIARMRAGV